MDIILCKTKKPVRLDQVLNMIHVDKHGHYIFKPDNDLVEDKEIDLSNSLGINALPPTITDEDVTCSVSIGLNTDSFDSSKVIKIDKDLILSK